MKTYYYIAYSKRRGGRTVNVGDGLLDAKNAKEVRQEISRAKGISQRGIVVRPYVKSS